MMTILHVVQKWWPYLLGNPCCIKTNHQSLKYFLEQRVHPQHNRNGLANSRVMTMRSITRRLRTILWWILFPTHLMPLSLFQLLLCLFQLGYTLFSKAMSMTPHYLKSSNYFPVTPLWYHISLGMALLWDTRVVWCFPKAHILNMQSSMNSMLLHRQGLYVPQNIWAGMT